MQIIVMAEVGIYAGYPSLSRGGFWYTNSPKTAQAAGRGYSSRPACLK
jgi:hypothetical protein